jgi:hypothetical protein
MQSAIFRKKQRDLFASLVELQDHNLVVLLQLGFRSRPSLTLPEN